MKNTFSRRSVLKMGAAATFAAPLSMAGTRLFAQAGQKITIVHPVASNLLLWSVTYLAEDNGFYKEAGFEIERVGLAGGPASMAGLLAGEGLMNASAPGECLSANARGQRVKIIESYTKSDAYTLTVTKEFADEQGVTADSSFEERQAALKGAKGKRFGITAPGSQSDLTTRMALAQVGLDPAADATIVPAGTFPNVITAMSQGALEGGVLLAPLNEQAIAEFGFVPLLSIAKGELPQAGRLQGQVLEAMPADIDATPDLFAAFVKADLRALQMIHETPNEVRDLLRKTRFSAVPEQNWQAVWEGQLPTFSSPYVPEDSLRAWLETGTIGGNPDPNTFPYKEVIDMRFVDQGLKELNWQPRS